MKKILTTSSLLFWTILLWSNSAYAQADFGTPSSDEPIPEKLQGLRRAIDVAHFPKENDPIKIDDTYYWKHATSILCKESEITIVEFGAYIFYNDQWNLRKVYDLKDLNRSFGTKKQVLLQAQPYTWNQNWRTGDTLFGGWALWYFIGLTADGEKVCGYETIDTTSNLLTPKN
ncbi:MAG: hypothetical protein HKN48_08850 [Flavobacteriaceae bacterium]|nr:hypothetical protein [Flavobacteriaceae bacterium]